MSVDDQYWIKLHKSALETVTTSATRQLPQVISPPNQTTCWYIIVTKVIINTQMETLQDGLMTRMLAWQAQI